jgi:hypothetical protein
MKVTQYTKGKQARFQIIVPVMLQPFVLPDGKKIQRTHSFTFYAQLTGDSIVHSGMGSFGKLVNGKPEIKLPSILQTPHEAYKEFKKPAEQKAIEAIIHNEPVLRENAA